MSPVGSCVRLVGPVLQVWSASVRGGLKPLSRDAYIARSPHLTPVFPHARELLFDIYSQYEERKNARGDEDAIDRMIKIVHGLGRHGLEARLQNVIQEIYVDGAWN